MNGNHSPSHTTSTSAAATTTTAGSGSGSGSSTGASTSTLMDPNMLIQQLNTATKHDRKRCYDTIRQLIGRMAFDPPAPGKRTSQARLVLELLDHAGRTKRWSGSKLTHSGHLALALLLDLARKEPAVYAEFDSNDISNEDLLRARLELHLRVRGLHGYAPEQLTALEFLLFLTQFAPHFEYRKFVKSEWTDVDNYFVVKGPIPIPRTPPPRSNSPAPVTNPVVSSSLTAASRQSQSARSELLENPALATLSRRSSSIASPMTPSPSTLMQPHFDQSSLSAHCPALEFVQLVINKEAQQPATWWK